MINEQIADTPPRRPAGNDDPLITEPLEAPDSRPRCTSGPQPHRGRADGR
ncbi:hypothetical protein OG723_02200 [Streptomyces sp. NBC_01278]|nr:hypothetical protein [Streptomyces sp. NBC_01278]